MTDTTQFMTAVFKCDLRKVDGNPHHKDTPFGRAVTLAVGDAITEQQAEIERLRAAGNDVIRASNTMMLMLAGELELTKSSIEAAIRRSLDARNEWDNARKALEAKP